MEPSCKRSDESAGFSLVEVLVASVVLVVGVVGMLAVFPQSYRDTTNSGRVSVLNHLAAGRLEELRSLPYDDGDLTTGIHPVQQSDSMGLKYYPVAGFGEEFSLRWIVSAGPTDSSGNPVAGIKRVFVEATYLTRYTTAGAPITNPNSLRAALTTFVTE